MKWTAVKVFTYGITVSEDILQEGRVRKTKTVKFILISFCCIYPATCDYAAF